MAETARSSSARPTVRAPSRDTPVDAPRLGCWSVRGRAHSGGGCPLREYPRLPGRHFRGAGSSVGCPLRLGRASRPGRVLHDETSGEASRLRCLRGRNVDGRRTRHFLDRHPLACCRLALRLGGPARTPGMSPERNPSEVRLSRTAAGADRSGPRGLQRRRGAPRRARIQWCAPASASPASGMERRDQGSCPSR